MTFFTDFISQYGMVIVYAVLTAIAGFLGAQVKKIYEKHTEDDTTGTAVTAITLGGQYEGALAEALGSGSQHLGLALAAVQTCYDFTYNFSDDQGKLGTLSNLVKNIANNAVGYFGSAALQVGLVLIAG